MSDIGERDWYRCVRCGTIASGGAVHHRVLGNRSNNAAWNLILLCGACHRWVHKNSAAAREGGWIVSRHAPHQDTVAVLYSQPGREGWHVLGADLTVTPAF